MGQPQEPPVDRNGDQHAAQNTVGFGGEPNQNGHSETTKSGASYLNERDIAAEWADRVLTSAHLHYRSAVRYARLQSWLGIPTVLCTTIVGTSVFASLQSKPDPWWQIIIGLLSIAAAVLSALQAFLNYNEKAEKHRVAGASYNSVRRELQHLLAQDKDWERLSDIRRRIDDLAWDSPYIPESVLAERRRSA